MSDLIKNLTYYKDGPSDNDILKILKKISQNPLSYIQFFNNNGKLSTFLEAMVVCGSAKIFYVSSNTTNLFISYNTCKRNLPDLKISYAITDESKYSEKSDIVFVTASYAMKRILEKCNNEEIFCSAIIIDNIQEGNICSDIFCRLWNYLYNKKSCVMPYLVLTGCSNDINKLPFNLEEEQIYRIKGKSEPIDIKYHNKNYPPGSKKLYSDMYKEIESFHYSYIPGDSDLSKWLVIVPSKSILDNMVKEIKENIPDIDVVVFSEETGSMGISKALKKAKAGKRMVIFTTDISGSGVYFQDIDGIFDSIESRELYETTTGGEKFFTRKTSKTLSFLRSISNRNSDNCFCYRMCTEKYYKELSYSIIPEFFRVRLQNHFIELIKNNLNPEEIFNDRNNTKKFIKTLNNLKLTLSITPNKNNYSITDIGKFKCQKYLSTNCAALVYRWFEKDYPKFPILVLVSLIEKGDTSLIWYPSKPEDISEEDYLENKRKNYEEQFGDLLSKNILIFYMNLWSKFSKEFKSLEIKDKNIKEWCKINLINYSSFMSIVSKVKELYDNLSEDYHIEIGLFDNNKFFEKAKPLIESTFLGKIFKTKYRKYVNSENKKAIIDSRNHYNPLEYRSKTIVAFSESTKFQKNKEENIIGFYAPLD